ncbi:MAG: superoxide dismutase [Candidatus Gracilibacteria bacterium]|nr:superoxide dismutase [Candidatus Gracilibacteria bacterium]
MKFSLPPLPYEKDALEPHMSAQTLELHHDKHHAAYIKKTNAKIDGTKFEELDSLQSIFQKAHQEDDGIFNNAAQAWNHEFFWETMTPGAREVTGEIKEKLDHHFKNFDAFADEFAEVGASQFGSGWVWLVQNGEKLEIMKTPNAENPLVHGKKPLIGCDVWEHSYYLDYQNRRPEYLKNFIENLVNWDVVNQRLAQ